MNFPKEGILFLEELAANNNRDWFTSQKAVYELKVKKPATQFAELISAGLSETLNATIEYKIFRINRDMRFSKDKTPYNTYVRCAFWDTQSRTKKAMGGPAFYLSIEPGMLHIGAGCMAFPPEMLNKFRQKVVSDAGTAATMEHLKNNGARFDPPELKRVPNDFDKNHARAELLKRKGLAVWFDDPLPKPRDISAKYCLEQFQHTLPIYKFVRDLD